MDIKKVEQELTIESKNIDKDLNLLTNSTKKTAELLLVKKRLYRLLMELQLQRLPKINRTEIHNYFNATLPHDNEQTIKNTPVSKNVHRVLNNIDGVRKCVGDFDIKIFHANDIKNKWNQQQDKIKNFTIDNLSLILDNESDDVISSEDFDSDDFSFDDNWTYMGITNPLSPSNCHHCRNIGHHRCKSCDYKRTKTRHTYLRRQRKEMLNKRQKQHIPSSPLPTHDTPFLPCSGKLHNKMEELLKTLKDQFQDKHKREKRERDLRTKLDLLAVNDKFDSTYQILSKKLNDCISQGVWKDKEIQRTKKQLDELRKRRGFSKIARAFMAVGEDPNLAEITSSILQSSSGENSGGVPITTTAPSKPSDDSDELSFEHYVDQEKKNSRKTMFN
jgi:hypothetical protein